MIEFEVFFTSVRDFAGHAASVVDEMFWQLNDDDIVLSDTMDDHVKRFIVLQTQLEILESLIHTLHERTEQFKELKDIKVLLDQIKEKCNGKGTETEKSE